MNITKTCQEAADQGFVVVRGDRNYAVSNSYWHWCIGQKRPFILVRLKTVYAVISVDLDTVSGYGLRKPVALELDHLFQASNRRIGREGFTVPTEGSTYLYATRIPQDEVLELAKKCFDLVSQENSLISHQEFYALRQKEIDEINRRLDEKYGKAV